MTIPVDSTLMAGFAAEVRSHLPDLRATLARVGEPADPQPLDDARQRLEGMRDASAMVGLDDLGQMLDGLLGALDDFDPQAPLDAELDALESALDSLAASGASPVAPAQAPSPPPVHALTPDLTQPSPSDHRVEPSPALPPRRKIQPSPEVREIFTAEADEHGQAIAGHLAELRVGTDRRDPLGALRRRVHNLKGSAALVGLDDLSRVAHGMEDLLDLLDLQGRGPTADELATLTRAGDALQALIYRDGADIDLDRVLDRLRAAVDHGTRPAEPLATADPTAEPSTAVGSTPDPAPAPVSPPRPIPPATSARDDDTAGAADDGAADASDDGTARRFVRVPVDALDEAVRLLVEVDAERQQLRALLRDQNGNLGELDRTDRRLRREVRRLETELEVAALDGGPQPTAPNSPFDALELDRYTSLHERSRALIESTGDLETLRVDLGREAISLGQSVDRLDGVTTRLRDRLLGMRLVPLRTLASRLQGVVRLAADRLGKTVRLELDDQRVELDKDVLDALVDPLDHLLRNAVAHGVEAPETRAAADKATLAVIRVDARYTPRGVEVRVIDDGAGLDLERLGRRAVERGIWTAETLAEATPKQLAELIFEPGLSTAAAIDRIAGRGVGMDVVRQRLGELRGRVEVESTRGEGTAVVLELPTSLAVQHVLLVDDGGYRLAVPAIGVERIERIDAERLEPVGDHTVLRSDDRIYRVARLANALGLPSATPENPERPVAILVRQGDQDLAVVVDAMAGGRDVVVQDLGRHLRRLPGLLGVTHVGSGHPVPIVDPAAWFGIDATARPAVQVDTRAEPDAAPVVLVVDDSLSMRRYLGQVVQRFGYRAVEARDGRDALDRLAAGIDGLGLVLLDLEMPRMDGFELMASLRADPAFGDVPRVVLSSRGAAKHRERAAESGADAYLVKPVAETELRSTLAQQLVGARR